MHIAAFSAAVTIAVAAIGAVCAEPDLGVLRWITPYSVDKPLLQGRPQTLFFHYESDDVQAMANAADFIPTPEAPARFQLQLRRPIWWFNGNFEYQAPPKLDELEPGSFFIKKISVEAAIRSMEIAADSEPAANKKCLEESVEELKNLQTRSVFQLVVNVPHSFVFSRLQSYGGKTLRFVVRDREAKQDIISTSPKIFTKRRGFWSRNFGIDDYANEIAEMAKSVEQKCRLFNNVVHSAKDVQNYADQFWNDCRAILHDSPPATTVDTGTPHSAMRQIPPQVSRAAQSTGYSLPRPGIPQPQPTRPVQTSHYQPMRPPSAAQPRGSVPVAASMASTPVGLGNPFDDDSVGQQGQSYASADMQRLLDFVLATRFGPDHVAPTMPLANGGTAVQYESDARHQAALQAYLQVYNAHPVTSGTGAVPGPFAGVGAGAGPNTQGAVPPPIQRQTPRPGPRPARQQDYWGEVSREQLAAIQAQATGAYTQGQYSRQARHAGFPRYPV